MKISLSTGKVVDVPASLYFSLSDEDFHLELEELISRDMGSDSIGIWDGSILLDKGGSLDKIEDLDEEELDDSIDLELFVED